MSLFVDRLVAVTVDIEVGDPAIGPRRAGECHLLVVALIVALVVAVIAVSAVTTSIAVAAVIGIAAIGVIATVAVVAAGTAIGIAAIGIACIDHAADWIHVARPAVRVGCGHPDA